MSSESTPRRVPARALAAGVLVALALGSGLVGAAIDRFLVRARMSAAIIGDTAFHPLSSALRSPTDADRRQYRAELTEQLALSAEQEREIDTIMAHRSGQFRDLREEIRPRVEELVGAFRGDIEKILTPDQRVRFRRLEGQPIGPVPPDSGRP